MKSGFCTLWGRPNAGKSTLLNALLGRKHVIVSPRPQTTRHRIAGVLHGGDEFQIVFLDTPGIHEPEHKLGETLVKNAKSALSDIECVVFVADCTDYPHSDDHRAAKLLEGIKIPVILACNKIDRAPNLKENRKRFEKLFPFDAVVEISALQGSGLDELKSEIISRLPDGEAYFPADMMGDRPPEFHIEELIREQAMLQLREEVPHSVAVSVEQMAPRKNGTLFVEAVLFVERESQKGIVVGDKGARIKEIGAKARKEIEESLGRSVYLELRAKVRDKWRDNETWISRLGYSEK
ncbi:GTP-binding protein Era [Abditibacterium utsteinense]|uniref:GTPase Era n=1 Tax=Abditibacterium utsteinense TaxID=1960156 RepID=A0A2S8SX23_9BACT|nr:GTPase Era [Abditibacterium utsteinense]PQV65345.1 GTP-binding protein Era [Abditibacterium utsteinense]